MARRERINPIIGWGMVSFTAFCELLSLLFGMVGAIGATTIVFSVISIAGSAADFVLSVILFIVLSLWFFSVSATVDRMLTRVKWLVGLLLIDLVLSPLPYIDVLVDFVMLFAVTAQVYLFIKKVQAEDEEYNKKEEEKLKQVKPA